MNVNIWPPCVPKSGWQEIRPLADVITIFADDLVNHYHPSWDLQSPDVGRNHSGGRQWYLRREKGLRAFARYEAKLRLKHFAKNGLITGAEYCACRLQEMIFKWGWREALSAGCVPHQWEKFISWPGIKSRLQLWKSRKTLARYGPDLQIKLYALLYDRAAPVPLEFCTDDYSAFAMNGAIQREEWPGKRTDVSRENVRRWRRDLGLKLSAYVVAKFPHPRRAKRLRLPTKETGVEIDHAAAEIIGLPFDLQPFRKLSPKSAG